jgi:hypothetical protein
MRARIVAEGYRLHRGTGELTDELTPSGTGMAEEVFNNAPPPKILDVPTRSLNYSRYRKGPITDLN